ncbi:hypothetical protein LIER_37445 [Lithospermum erythrorhizon]|uniref:Reverse transcriptase RNase H-like domain-containing protein n=1 Tax=Lithospermum erythrorhizon TaxID=34254 RepID=A0AAV3PPS6_LITER
MMLGVDYVVVHPWSSLTLGDTLTLVREEEKVQRPVYYISWVMGGAKIRYPLVEKLVFPWSGAARKIKPYFEAHPLKVITDQPLRQILENPIQFGQLVKGAIQLCEVGLRSNPMKSIKARALANLMGECTHTPVGKLGFEALANGLSLRKCFGGRTCRHQGPRKTKFLLLVGYVKSNFGDVCRCRGARVT